MWWIKYNVGHDGFAIGTPDVVESANDPVADWWEYVPDNAGYVCPFVSTGPFTSREEALDAAYEEDDDIQ